MIKRITDVAGYSLLEVMVAIIIMTLAILPMVGMFDMGLHSTTEGSKYDKARMLANLKLEQAKNLPFDSDDPAIQDVKDNFPKPAGTETIYVDGKYETDPNDPEEEPGFPGFTYLVEKQYMTQPCLDPDTGELDLDCPSWDFSTSTEPTNLIRIKVTVQWDDNEYKTYGLVTG